MHVQVQVQQASQRAQARLAVVVMGVSGTGKSSVAAGLAGVLGVPWIDGDDLHAPHAVARMRSGVPLVDDDRWPWLARIGARLNDAAAPAGVVVACSALKRTYRDRLRAAAPGLHFVCLDGPSALVRQRMQQRSGHYMPPQLLDSQLQAFEKPGTDEADVLHARIDEPVPLIVAAVGARLLECAAQGALPKVFA